MRGPRADDATGEHMSGMDSDDLTAGHMVDLFLSKGARCHDLIRLRIGTTYSVQSVGLCQAHLPISKAIIKLSWVDRVVLGCLEERQIDQWRVISSGVCRPCSSSYLPPGG